MKVHLEAEKMLLLKRIAYNEPVIAIEERDYR